jgi:molybdate transport system regulatory protein
MNILIGTITGIQSHNDLSLIKVMSNGITFTAIILDTSVTADYLAEGKSIQLLFKETEVIISKDLDINISIQNRIPCKIQSIIIGNILSQVNLLFGEMIIKSIITSNAVKQLVLKENDIVLALIKTNEISLSPND